MNNPYYINTGLGNVYKSGGSFKKYKKAVKKLYDAYLWGSPETELTKKEYKKHKKDLWEGLNQSKEVLASLNKEELKHPTNGQLVESYNNDNEIPLDYNYNVFNTARRDREQAAIDAYNYNQSLLTPGQKAANSVAARNNYRGLSYLMNGLAASPLMFAGAGSVGEIYKILTHPLTDAALTAHGAITAPSNIREGIKNIKEGNTGEGIFNLGMTALDLTGAGQLVGRTGRMFNKAYRAKHAYNTIAPAGYGNISKRGKEWIKDLWYNPDVDLYNPKWYKDKKAKKKNNNTHRGLLKTGNYLARDVLHSGEISDKARMDAWAIYNGLPQPHNTYIKNADGTYSYDMKRIMDISENTWHPTIVPEKGKRKTGDVFDFVTGSGGGLTDFQLLADDKFGNGIMRIEDTWDLHPFSRDDQLFNIKLGNWLIDKFGSQNRRNAVQRFREKMFDMGIFGLDRTPIQRLTYPIDRVLNKYRMGSLAPTFDIGNTRIYGLTDKIIHDLVNSKAANKVTDYLKNFEVGKVSGGNPFIMKTDIPFHDLAKDPSGAYLRELAEKESRINDIDDIVSKLAAKWEFAKISPYRYGFNPNYIANPQPYFQYDNNLFKINTDLFIKGNNAYGGSLDANPEKPPVNSDLDTKYDTKLPKGKEKEYSQWVESLPLNLRDDHDYDLRGAFLEGLKPDKYGHMSDKYKKPWHPTFSNESIYSTKDMQGGHWEGDEFVPSPWQERRQQLINSMNLMEPNTFSNGGTIHIKPENKGKFTAAAKRAGKSVQGYASQILANPDNYSSTLVKRANFARNAAKWHACGGKLYPDGGPIDPPWASFVPSQPREPQVVKPQPQVNPYLLGLSAGMGQNEAAKYSTAAQTPEFQQGYYDGQAQVAASEAAKAGRTPIVEPGIEVVSPVLSVLPGTGDVKDFADIADYYYNTGDLATSLGLAALTVASPVQGVGKLGKLSNEAKALKMLQDAEYNMKHYAERIAEKPKPLGSIDYKIPEGEKVPELNPISKRLEIPYAPEGHSKFKKEAGEQFDKALKEQSKKIKSKDSKKSAETIAQERVAQIETDPSDMTRWQKAKAWTFKPWKERSKLRKGVEGTIGTSLGLSTVGYGIKEGFDIAENAKKSVDYNFNPASARPDSVTAARYYEDFIKDSLANEANGDVYLDLGYPKELVDSVKNDNLKKLFERYQEYLPYKTQ